MELLERIERLIRRKDICVLATAGSGGPHTSLMAYSCSPETLHLYMLTPMRSLKYRNILENPIVSLLIDTREESAREQVVALTISAKAIEITDPLRRRSIAANLSSRHPQLRPFTQLEQMAVLQVVPAAFQLQDGVARSHYLAAGTAERL